MNRILIAIAVFCTLFVSCQKQDTNQYNCGEPAICANVLCIAFLSNFTFSIVDKTTGEDLIFGPNATLTPADIKLFGKSNSPYTERISFADSTNKVMRTIFSSDTMAIQIKNEPLKYISVKTFCSNECCSRNAVEIVFEGQLLVADKNKVIRIKR